MKFILAAIVALVSSTTLNQMAVAVPEVEQPKQTGRVCDANAAGNSGCHAQVKEPEAEKPH